MVERVISAMLPHLYVYNTDHNLKENMLNPERLEKGWLVMKMVEFQLAFLWHRKRSEVPCPTELVNKNFPPRIPRWT